MSLVLWSNRGSSLDGIGVEVVEVVNGADWYRAGEVAAQLRRAK